MNKKLVAAALGLAFAAPVFADSSNVTLYGRLHTAIENNNYEADSGDVGPSGPAIANYSSRLGVRGQEDLGGGLNAIFAIEFGVDSDDSGGAGSTRHTYIGMKSDSLGTFVIGQQDGGNDSQAPLYNQAQNYMLNGQNNAGALSIVNGGSLPFQNALRDSLIEAAGGPPVTTASVGSNFALISRQQRVDNSIGYANTIAGVKISARHALTGADANNSIASDENDSSITEVSADYTIGNLTFGGGYAGYNYSASTEQAIRNVDNATLALGGAAGNAEAIQTLSVDNQYQLGAKYNFGAFTLAGLYGETELVIENVDIRDVGLSALLPLTANSGLTGAFVDQQIDLDGDKIDGTQLQLMYYYDFSKRTRTYAGVNRTEFEYEGGGEDTFTSLVAGIRHNF